MSEKAPKANCDSCTLQPNPFVPSELHKDAFILVLAEAPGKEEVTLGRPLVGQAGQELNAIIASVGARRSMFNFVNACCCRAMSPDGKKNRNPDDNELTCCRERLFTEIKAIRPGIIVCLGGSAYYGLFQERPKKFGDVVGVITSWQGIPVIPTYHPAKILYEGGRNSNRGGNTAETIGETIGRVVEITSKLQPPLLNVPEVKTGEYSILKNLKETCKAWYGDKLDREQCKKCAVRFYCWEHKK